MDKFTLAKQAEEEATQAAIQKRLQKLESQAVKKTAIEAEKPYYLALTGLKFILQVITFAMSIGIVLFAFTAFDSIIASLALCILFALTEPVKHYLNKYYNQQRLYQDKVPQIALVLILSVGLWSASTSFIGTPYSVEKIVAKPELIDIAFLKDSLNNKATLAAAFWSGKADQANTTAKAYFKSRSWKGRISRKDTPKHKELLSVSSRYSDSLTTAQASAAAILEQSVSVAEATNKQTMADHKAFCSSVGFWSSIAVLIAELLYFLIERYRYNFEKRELAELRKILKPVSKPKRKPEKVIDFGSIAPKTVMAKAAPIGFSQSKKHGQIIPSEGRKKPRILYQKEDGSLKAYTLGEFDNLIRAAKTEGKRNELTSLRKKLENYG